MLQTINNGDLNSLTRPKLNTLISNHNQYFVNVKDYGATGDGITDDTAAIQAAVDFCLELETNAVVFLPLGRYVTSDTIQLGYGQTYSSIEFIGVGRGYRGEISMATIIDASGFSDRPAVAIQGARSTNVRHMTILGANKDFIKNNNLGSGTNTTVPDLLESDWVDPTLHANADSVTAPYVGIAVDPYCGVAPTVPYPDVTFPAFTGITTQYEKSASNKIKFEDVECTGFVAGWVLQPNDQYDGNGDFVAWSDISCPFNVYGISVGQSQARSFNIDGNSEIDHVHTSITSRTHGKQIGKVRGAITGVGFGSSIQIVNVGSDYSGLTFTGCYVESIYKFGYLGNDATVNHPTTLIGCEISFGNQGLGLRGFPKYSFEGSNVSINLHGCTIKNRKITDRPDCAYIVHPDINLSASGNTKIVNGDTAPTTDAEAIFRNFQQGGVINTRMGVIDYNVAFKSTEVDAPYSQITPAFRYTPNSQEPEGRDLLLPRNAMEISFSRTPAFSQIESIKEQGSLISTSGWTGITVNGRDVSVDIGTSDIGDRRALSLIDLGDIIFHNDTCYYVSNRVGTVVTFRAVSGLDGSDVIETPITASGDATYFHARKFALLESYYADFTAGNATFEYFRSYDRFVGNMNSEIQVGDRMMITGDMIGVYSNFSSYPRVVSIDDTAGTITVDDAPNVTKSGVKLAFFSRTFNT